MEEAIRSVYKAFMFSILGILIFYALGSLGVVIHGIVIITALPLVLSTLRVMFVYAFQHKPIDFPALRWISLAGFLGFVINPNFFLFFLYALLFWEHEVIPQKKHTGDIFKPESKLKDFRAEWVY